MEENKANIDLGKILDIVKDVWNKSLKKFWWIVLIVSVLMAIYAYRQENNKPIVYSGGTSFILESEDITSQAGGTAMEGNVLISNFVGSGKSNKVILMALFASNKMKELTLLSNAEVDGKEDLLVNHYIRLGGGAPDSTGSYGFDTSFKYGEDPEKDSKLRLYAESLRPPTFTAGTSEEGLFYLLFSHKNEDFTLAMIRNHIDVISNYYTSKRLEKAQNVLKFSEEHRDEIKSKLASAEYSLAALMDRSRGAVMSRAFTEKMKLERKVEVYNEMYLNAEVTYQSAKVNVLKKTPYIQIIDEARSPLRTSKNKPFVKAVIFFVVFLLLGFMILVGLYFLKNFIAQQKEALRSREVD